MTDPLLYQRLADAVLALHFALVAFVVGGLVAILVGNALGWRWVNRRGFRIAHLAAIVIVAAEAWFGITCPLTALEWWLRGQAGTPGAAAANDSFVGYWLHGCFFTARRRGCLCWPTPASHWPSCLRGGVFRRTANAATATDAGAMLNRQMASKNPTTYGVNVACLRKRLSFMQ